jgi:hypothetical protein
LGSSLALAAGRAQVGLHEPPRPGKPVRLGRPIAASTVWRILHDPGIGTALSRQLVVNEHHLRLVLTDCEVKRYALATAASGVDRVSYAR